MILDRLSELLEPTLPPSAYVVRGARDYRRVVTGVVLPLGALLAFAAVAQALGFGGGWGFGFVVWLAFGAYSLVTMLRRPELVRIDAEAVRFGDVVVPWPSVWQVVVLRDPYGAEPVQVGLRLRRGAPLPEALDSLVQRPGDAGVHEALRSHVTGTAVDVERVAVAVRAFAPYDVELVERAGGREDVLDR